MVASIVRILTILLIRIDQTVADADTLQIDNQRLTTSLRSQNYVLEAMDKFRCSMIKQTVPACTAHTHIASIYPSREGRHVVTAIAFAEHEEGQLAVFRIGGEECLEELVHVVGHLALVNNTNVAFVSVRKSTACQPSTARATP